MKKKPDTRRYGSFWICPNCEGSPEFDHEAMMKHLKDAHQIDPKSTKGKKSMLMHLDGDTWFSWDFEWEIGGLKFNQHTCNKRSQDDMMRWA